MSGKIQVLPQPLAQVIAAGEVIERPASVVKELMENAIDAGASDVVVELNAGGFHLIRVQDNGEGMDPEDVPVALQRHATSKIRRLEDLYAVQTLGFRGEALPSIASVSQMVIKTRTSRSIKGTRLVCEGGEVRGLSEVGCPVGTEVEVRNLFFNVPVKRKFLKSISLELRHGLTQFLRLSLAHPRVSFKFIHDGRLLHEHARTENSKARIEAIFGREASDQLQPFRDEDGMIALTGWASVPTFSRGNGDGIYLYVNGRFVKDRAIYKAVLEAYRHVIPAGRFPMAILFLDVPASTIDVNVHPTKTEVKFKDPERIFPAVYSALRSLHEPVSSERDLREEGGLNGSVPLEEKGVPLPFPHSVNYPERGNPRGETAGVRVSEAGPAKPAPGNDRKPFRIVGQVLKTYILCEDSEGLIFVDQHAAHERLLFERLKSGCETRSLAVSRFLTPPMLECSPEEALAISDHLSDLRSMGIEVDSVGKKTFAIRSVPALLDGEDPREVFRRVLEEGGLDRPGGKEKGVLRSILVALSCHSAVRANLEMRREEMQALVDALRTFPVSTTCPHGRPIFFRLPKADLEKEFKRHPR